MKWLESTESLLVKEATLMMKPVNRERVSLKSPLKILIWTDNLTEVKIYIKNLIEYYLRIKL